MTVVLSVLLFFAVIAMALMAARLRRQGVCLAILRRAPEVPIDSGSSRVRETEARFRMLFEESPDGIFVEDEQGRILDVNPMGCRLRGQNRDELLGRNVFESPSPDKESSIRRGVTKLRDGRATFAESVIRHVDGRATPVEVKASRIVYNKQPAILLHVRDITERKKTEAALSASRRMLESVMNSIPQGVFWKDRTGAYLGANRVVRQALGFDRLEQLAGRTDAEFPFISPDQADVFMCKDREVMQTGVPQRDIQESLTMADGRTILLHTTKLPLRDDEGRVIGVLGTWQDVTERVRSEEELRASLREKSALLQEVHHRVKNNLQIIKSLLSLQADQLTDPEARAALERARQRIVSMSLVHEMLYRPENLARLDLAEYIEGLTRLLVAAYTLEAKRPAVRFELARLTLDLDRAIPCGLIVNELVSNALKYAFPGERSGTLSVCLEELATGEYTIGIGDDGVGLPSGEGVPAASLGLRLVELLVRQLRGRLDVDRAGGTSYRFTFSPTDS